MFSLKKYLVVLQLKKVWIPLTILLLIGVFTLYLFFGPIFVNFGKISRLSYNESLSEFDNFVATENDLIDNRCKSILMNHGVQTKKAIVFYHGYTNCPEQFRNLGQEFYNLGYNVFIPRMPFHGQKDRLTNDLSKLTPQILTDFTRQTVSILSGLGENIYTSGISGGGVLASASGYYYDFIDKVIVISPLFIAYDLPVWGLDPFIKIRNFIPDYYRWWDEEQKETISGPNYAYPRFSFKASMSFMEVGKQLTIDIHNNSNLANPDVKIVHIYTENDKAVKNYYNQNLLDTWGQKLNQPVNSFAFSADYDFNHDIIDSNQEGARPDIVYPKILELAEKD